MKIFITGSNGLLGSRIAEIALERSYDVYSGFNSHELESGKPVKFDLANPDNAVKAIGEIKSDVIVHSAALTDVDRCETEEELGYKINVGKTKVIAEVARKFGSFLVYVSTDYIFDENKGLYKVYDETNPVNYYGYINMLREKYY